VAVRLPMRNGDDPAFDAATARWINLFTRECPGVALTEVDAAVEALALPPAIDASATLTTSLSDRR
jgi:hypothetical protein